MKKMKIYLDTSAIGYLDEQTYINEKEEMHELWSMIKNDEYTAVISQVVMKEIMAIKDYSKRDVLLEYLTQINYTIVEITDETHKIAQSIILNGILTGKKYNDCLHIALAIISECDCLVSYNFRDMVNIRIIKGARAISNLFAKGNIDIVSARVLIQRGTN